MLPCAFPAGKCFPACSGFPLMPCAFPARSGFPIALCIGTSAGSCFPMLPQRLPLEHLPRSSFRTAATRGAVTSSAQTSASLHPPAALRLRVLPFTRAWTPTVCAEEFPTPLEMSLPGQVRGYQMGNKAVAWLGFRCLVLDDAVSSQGAGVGWQMMLLVVRGTVPANHRARESLF